MKKYNRSQRKNNTRRKTHKKRVRKTHKKRTHKRMKGGSDSRHDLNASGNISDTTSYARIQDENKGLLDKIKNFFSNKFQDIPIQEPVSAAGAGLEMEGIAQSIASQSEQQPIQGNPQSTQNQQTTAMVSFEDLKENQEMMYGLHQFLMSKKNTNPELYNEYIRSLSLQQSEKGKKELIFNYANKAAPYLFATGLFNPHLLVSILVGLGLGAVGSLVTLGVAKIAQKIGKGIFAAGKGVYRGVGSLKDKAKFKALMANINQCLKILVKYAVINDTASKVILDKLKKNAGYATEITFDEDKREDQINKRKYALKKRDENKAIGNYALNIGTPEVVANTTPQQLSVSPPPSTDVTLSVESPNFNHPDANFTPEFGAGSAVTSI